MEEPPFMPIEIIEEGDDVGLINYEYYDFA